MVMGFLDTIIVPLLVISPLLIVTFTTSGFNESFLIEEIASAHVSMSIAVTIILPLLLSFL